MKVVKKSRAHAHCITPTHTFLLHPLCTAHPVSLLGHTHPPNHVHTSLRHGYSYTSMYMRQSTLYHPHPIPFSDTSLALLALPLGLDIPTYLPTYPPTHLPHTSMHIHPYHPHTHLPFSTTSLALLALHLGLITPAPPPSPPAPAELLLLLLRVVRSCMLLAWGGDKFTCLRPPLGMMLVIEMA